MNIVAGVTCAGCPTDLAFVSDFPSSPVVGPALRLGWVLSTHASLFLFATVVRSGSSLT